MLVWRSIIGGVFAGGYLVYLLTDGDVPAGQPVPALILLATIILVCAVWQAAGMVAAQVEMALRRGAGAADER